MAVSQSELNSGFSGACSCPLVLLCYRGCGQLCTQRWLQSPQRPADSADTRLQHRLLAVPNATSVPECMCLLLVSCK